MSTPLLTALARTRIMQMPLVVFLFLRLQQKFQSLVTSSYLWRHNVSSHSQANQSMDRQGSSAGLCEKIHTPWLAHSGAKRGTTALLENFKLYRLKVHNFIRSVVTIATLATTFLIFLQLTCTNYNHGLYSANIVRI